MQGLIKSPPFTTYYPILKDEKGKAVKVVAGAFVFSAADANPYTDANFPVVRAFKEVKSTEPQLYSFI